MKAQNDILGITGVVLAGGESSRMEEDKSLILFRKKKLIDFSLIALKPYCKEVFISSSKIVHQAFDYKIIKDEYDNIGPIAGIHSALKNATTDYVIILPCDSPMVKKQFIEFLISEIAEDIDAVIPKNKELLEPLFGIYHKRILPVIEKQIIRKDYKLGHLIEKINTKIIEVQDRSCFININTKSDFQKYLSV